MRIAYIVTDFRRFLVFIYLNLRGRGTETEKYLPSVGSFPKRPQSSHLAEEEAERPKRHLHLGSHWQELNTWAVLSAFPGTAAGSWPGGGAATTTVVLRWDTPQHLSSLHRKSALPPRVSNV